MNEQNTVEEHLRTLSGRKLEYRRIVTNDELKKTKKRLVDLRGRKKVGLITGH